MSSNYNSVNQNFSEKTIKIDTNSSCDKTIKKQEDTQEEGINKMNKQTHELFKTITHLLSALKEHVPDEVVMDIIKNVPVDIMTQAEHNNTKTVDDNSKKLVKNLKYFDDETIDEIRQKYNDLIAKHDVTITPSYEFVHGMVDAMINHIKSKENTDAPEEFDIVKMSHEISDSLPDTVSLDEFYNYVANRFINLASHHFYYDKLASYFLITRLHAITPNTMLECAQLLQTNVDKNGDISSILSPETYEIIVKHNDRIEQAIDMDRDYLFDFFGIKVLERSYLYKLTSTQYQYIERPQYMFMRVAIGIHGDDIDAIIETYDLMTQRYFTHATPTLFNAGTNRPQMSSCFLLGMEDNIESIFDTVTDISYISKWAGGIGVHLTALRGRLSLIRGTNGLALGIIPLCILLNKVAKYINQGGKRNGSIAVYLEMYHPDIYEFCDLRKDTGTDDNRARDLFLGLWVCDLFMKRVKNNEMWSLMCPDECPGLNTTDNEEFEALYTKYESEGKYRKQVRARDLWEHLTSAQAETGFPYVVYKDSANRKSNQKNLGTIRSSNLCAEIIEYSDDKETAVCNLASICISRFVKERNGEKYYDFQHLMDVTRVIIRNLNKVIDRNYYPTEKTLKSNMRHRPVGLGVQGLADVYFMMEYAFDSDEAKLLNSQIFESIYYASVDESMRLAKKDGHYESFPGSPFSEGKLQYHLWGFENSDLLMGYDWDTLCQNVKTYGTRNSLLTCCMPTASSSQIMGNKECIEPLLSNVFTRTVLAGEFLIVNYYLMKELMNIGLWTDDMRKLLIINNGSVQNIDAVPQRIKDVYKTAYELKQMHIVQQSADRGKFIDQSQSLNIFCAKPNYALQTSILFGGWEAGLKTGVYYLRTQSVVNPDQFGVDIDDIKRLTGNDDIVELIKSRYDSSDSSIEIKPKEKVCLWRPGMAPEDCLACGS
jgi:ribonucleoside-diphosphate reductase alpha chain